MYQIGVEFVFDDDKTNEFFVGFGGGGGEKHWENGVIFKAIIDFEGFYDYCLGGSEIGFCLFVFDAIQVHGCNLFSDVILITDQIDSYPWKFTEKFTQIFLHFWL